jgi:hypothetical protein
LNRLAIGPNWFGSLARVNNSFCHDYEVLKN